MDRMEQMLAFARNCAKEAGKIQLSYFRGNHLHIETKFNMHDVVTVADKESERYIIGEIKRTYPEHAILGEESGMHAGDSEYCWVIDPLDGTSNYIHDMAPYSVSIALRDREELLLGVVYEVCRNECFYAWKGGKAFMNGEEIHVSNVEDIKDAFVITELPYNHLQYKQTALHLIDQLYGVVGGIRMNGSAAAAICYVAIGRFDAWMEAFLGKWDYSAAALIVQEAGGKVTDFYGEDHFIEGHHIIATNGNLHPFFQKLLAEVPPLNM